MDQHIISCSLDEALLRMLGISIHPLPEGVDVTLEDILWTEKERAEADSSNAKPKPKPKVRAKKLSDEVIATAKAKLNEADSFIEKARLYQRDLAVELIKKDSVLTIDFLATQNPQFPYITFDSLEDWSLKRYGISVIDYANSRILAEQMREKLQAQLISEDTISTKPVKKPRTRMQDQEDSILDAIRALSYDPKNFPKANGISDAKSAVRAALQSNSLFSAKTAFKKTWERLRVDEQIVDMQ